MLTDAVAAEHGPLTSSGDQLRICETAGLDYDDAPTHTVNRTKGDAMDLEQTLAAAPLLANLDKKIIKRLAEAGTRRVYAPGDWIIHQDAPALALYVILRGHARAEKDGDQDPTPGELYAGDFFGELALIEDHPRTASVKAVEETECILFVAWEFVPLLNEHPEMAVPIMNALIKRLHRREHTPK